MAYISKSDYTTRISIDHLDEILTQAANTSGITEADVLRNAELTAEAEIRSYLTSKYKIDDEFSLTGGARNRLVMQWYMDICLYNLHFSVNPRDVPETRSIAYKMAIENLKAARDSNIVLGIPQVDPFYTRHLIGSNPGKFISHEFTDSSLFECNN